MSAERELIGSPTPILVVVALRGDRTYHAQLVINGIVIVRKQIPWWVGAGLTAVSDHIALRARVFGMQTEKDAQGPTAGGGMN